MSVRRGPRLSLEELAPYLLIAPDCGLEENPQSAIRNPQSRNLQWIDWRAVFGNDRPVELEVGFGKGLFLVTAAQARPEVNFAGVEIVRKYQLFAATRLAKRGLRNVRVTCADVRLFLPRCVATASLQAVHVYFPDPWWKKRHHKRRVFTAEFVGECARVLRPGGRLHGVTDVEEYARIMAELLAQQPALHPLPPLEPHPPMHDLDYLTNFERKFRKQGKPIFRMSFEKSGPIVTLRGSD
jgi:tRNA (guanine-N7-)-methyltransferase